jgi:hypothetical protein
MSILSGALDAFYDVVSTAALSDPDVPGELVQVLDGPEAAWPNKRFIAVGLTPDAVDLNGFSFPAGLRASTSELDIVSMIRAYSGGDTVRQLRDWADLQLDAVLNAVEADRRLHESVDNAELTSLIYLPQRSTRGNCVDLVFTVHVKIF